MPIVETIYQLPEMHYLRLRFQLTAAENAKLPYYKGSMLRGAFGHALRTTVCAMNKGTACAECILKLQCAYTRLFETYINGEPPRFLKGLDTAPRPFVFECADFRQVYPPGTPLSFDLILIGSAIDFVPYVLFSVLQMTQNGLGSNRSQFELAQADSLQPDDDWHQLYDATTQSLLFTPQPLILTNSDSAMTTEANPTIKLTFQTPTRLKFKGKYHLDFSFRELVFKMLRRTLELAYFYIPEIEINWEFHDLLVAAEAVQIAERNLRRSGWQRYSNRQKTKVDMSGFIGELVLKGELAPFMDLFKYIEVLHLGKGTVFGLGEVGVETSYFEISD